MPSETTTCPKVPHVGDGYLHGEDDDAPYSVDGVLYCGRCHYSVNAVTRTCERPASPSPAPTLAEVEAWLENRRDHAENCWRNDWDEFRKASYARRMALDDLALSCVRAVRESRERIEAMTRWEPNAEGDVFSAIPPHPEGAFLARAEVLSILAALKETSHAE